ncbi:hypothetical protein AB0L88_09570 [Saccharopolyspora shandongensis]|uniref:hypothetical protein n=1 Tax=Saccharopolyspora shandongensis TaxID=418495 RepID=UPI0034208471
MQDQLDSQLRRTWARTIKMPTIDYSRNFQFPAFDDWIKRLAERVSVTLASLDALPVKILRSKGPEHRADLDDDALVALMDLAKAGIPVTWVPRTTVLADLVDADPNQWASVLRANQTTILEDCLAVCTVTEHGP